MYQARMKEQIVGIHEESYQIYGAPKIKEILLNTGHKISQRTVSKYMKEEGIKTHYIKPYTITTRNSNLVIKHQFNTKSATTKAVTRKL